MCNTPGSIQQLLILCTTGQKLSGRTWRPVGEDDQVPDSGWVRLQNKQNNNNTAAPQSKPDKHQEPWLTIAY